MGGWAVGVGDQRGPARRNQEDRGGEGAGGRGRGEPRRALAQESTNPRRVDEKKKLNCVVIDKTPNPGVDQSRAGAHTRSTRPF